MNLIRQFAFLVYFELYRMSRLKRVYIALTILMFFVSMITLAVYQKKDQIGGRGTAGQMLRELLNATTFSQILMIPSVLLILPVIVGIFSASSYAGEEKLGLVRTMAMRPTSRSAAIGARFMAMSIFSYLLLFVLMVVSYLLGGIMFGFGGEVFCPGSREIGQKTFYVLSAQQGVITLVRTYFIAGFSLVSIVAMFLMFAIVMRKQGNAIVGAMGIYFVSFILAGMPMMEGIKPYLPSVYMMCWRYSLGRDMAWGSFGQDALILAGLTIAYLIVGVIVFRKRAL